MRRKDSEKETEPEAAEAMDAQPKTSAPAAKHYRCRTSFSIWTRSGEGGKNYGPGLMITGEEYEALIRDGLATPDRFEPMKEGERQ